MLVLLIRCNLFPIGLLTQFSSGRWGRGGKVPAVLGATLGTALALVLLCSWVRTWLDKVRLAWSAARAREDDCLLQAAERHAANLATLHRAAVAISSSFDMDQILKTLAEQLGSALDVASVYICDLEEQTLQSLVLAEWLSPQITADLSEIGRRYDLTQYPSTLRALIDKRPIIFQATDPDLDPADRQDVQRYGWKSQLVVPLLSQSRVIGYAELWETRQARQFSAAEVQLCQTLATDAAIAIERARLFQAEREQRELAEALEEAAAGVSSTLDLDQVLDRILEQVERVVAGDAFNIMLLQEELCRAVRSRGYGPLGVAEQVADLRMPISRYPTLAEMARTGRPVVVPDVLSSKKWVNLPGWDWLRSYVGAPIQIVGQVVGFLNVDGARADQFTPADAHRLLAFADHAATAIENARLFAEAQQRMAHLEVHNAVIAAAASAADLPELLGTTLGHILAALEMRQGSIWVADQRVSRDLPREVDAALRRAARSIHAETPFAVRDWSQLAQEKARAIADPTMARHNIRASLSVPIAAEGHHIGGMTLASSSPRAWSDEEVALVEAIGRHLGGVAERLRLLERTQEQARQVQQIINTVPEGVLLLDAERHVVLANPTAQEYLAVLAPGAEDDPLTHLGDRPVQEFLTPTQQGLWHQVATATPAASTFEVVAQPMETGPEAGGWVLLLRDVTREKALQAHIQQQNRLAAIGQLAGGIAHDFNNILTSIIMGAQLLLAEPELPMEIVSGLGAILAESRKATDLIRQILDFSRRSWIEPRPLSLQAFTQEVVEILQRTLPARIDIRTHLDPAPCIVQADPTRLQQAVVNLALNARDAMPDGGELSIRLHRLENEGGQAPPVSTMPPGEWACLAVSDTGSGIDPEVMPHLFEPFFTTKPPGQGTGLGLAQVYGIVKQHQGYIDAETQANQGTTFSIYLPIQEIVPHGGTSPDQVGDPLPCGKGERILIAEDEEGVRRLCARLLQSLGYQVLTARDGQEALAVYRSAEQISLVITDVVMPQIDGIELIQAIREERPQQKALAITGYPLGQDLRTLRDRGILAVIQKPIDLSLLAQTVRQLLDDPPEPAD